MIGSPGRAVQQVIGIWRIACPGCDRTGGGFAARPQPALIVDVDSSTSLAPLALRLRATPGSGVRRDGCRSREVYEK